MTIRLLLADDQALVRGALAALLSLESDLEVVAEVGRGDEVLEAARRTFARTTTALEADGTADPRAGQVPELAQLLAEVQQDALDEARSLGAYDSRTIGRAQKMLDSRALRRDGL